MTDPLFIPRGPIDDDVYAHCRHCIDDCTLVHYEPCQPCQVPR